MQQAYDYLIVGAGFAGSVAAERLARVFNKRVLLVDRRTHIGGNAFDFHDAHGVLIHKYGPHIFHTNSDEVFSYLSQFTEWRKYEHRVLASVDGKLVPIPINLTTINQLYDWSLNSEELEQYFQSVAEPVAQVRTSEDVIVGRVGRSLYEKFFRNYTRKQWALDPSELDASVTSRVPVRTDTDDRYFTDRHQAMPLHGYTAMFERMLDHPNIDIELSVDYADVKRRVQYRELIFTGPVDEYFDWQFGKLEYRSLEFRFETHHQTKVLAAAVVNYPNDHEYTRITEYTQLTGQQHTHSTLSYEIPRAEGDPYYPVPREANKAIYEKYRELAESVPDVHFTGRLATYRYYNMDQVVAQSLALCTRLTGVARSTLAAAT